MRLSKLVKTIGAFVAATALSAASPAGAQTGYPSKPIRFVVGFSAGGSTDVMARVLAQSMSAMLGQPIVIENKPGADSLIATQHVARSSPDGYTILIASGSHSINGSLYPDSKVDPVKDFTHIGMIGDAPNFIVVHPSVPANSVEELIALAKANPDKINASTSASTTFLATELFKSMAGIKTASIPYKGAGPATLALLSGEVQFSITSLVGMLPHVKAGKVRPLAVTSAKRSSLVPNVPTVTEKSVPGYVASTWYAVFAPANVPANIVQLLNATLHKAMQEPSVRTQLEGQGVALMFYTPEELAKFVQADTEKWAKVVRDSKAPAVQ
jgi:tripartite-type tricarboxylate transporter receptor subunit TctC